MTHVVYRELGEPPSGKPIIPQEPVKPRQARFQCTVCKCNCTIDLTTFGVPPKWCIYENDITNLRYAKWREIE